EQLKLDQDRRAFMKKSTLIGVGVAGAAVVPAVAIANTGKVEPDIKQQKGYQLTDHVVDYYNSAAN
ncbi:MAG: hypothetical protein ACI9JR_002169, partial [Gammaproteobacteria bacterium]